jgi:Domain of unknown function (DUF2017)
MARRRKNKLPFQPNGDGTFTIGLEAEAREFLADLPRQLRAIIDAEDEASTRRLFPPAYHRSEDGEREEEYRRFMREDLVTSKMGAMAMLQEKAFADTLTTDDMVAWMGAINDIRLVLGTQLDVYEGMDTDDLPDGDERLPALGVYGWLSAILELIVMGLSGPDEDNAQTVGSSVTDD